MNERDVPVLIAGGSLVGLSTSVLLASKGVPHLVVERHRGTSIYPRAALFHQGTIEVFRSVGLHDAVEEAASREFVQDGAILSVPHLRSDNPKFFFKSMNEDCQGLSATRRLFITQIGLEPVLREKAQSLGAEHLYGWELVSFEQDADGVTSIIRPRDGGDDVTVRSEYLVAADGAHSPIRQKLGIETLGRGTFANCATIYFKADLRDLLGDRNWSVVYVNHPEMLGFSRYSIDQDGGFLVVFSTLNEDGTWNRNVSDMDEATCIALVQKSLGDDRPVSIDIVQKWQAASGHSARYRDGRIFLAGDSAHVMPPTGGFGGNTGVADAYNLAWKLAMVVKGEATPALLDTYDPERRPAGDLTAEQAYTRYVLRVDPSLGTETLAPTMNDAAIELGPIYRSAAMIADGDDDGALLYDPRTPADRVGIRGPHVPVELKGKEASIHDVFGAGFVLLAGPDGEAWVEAARRVADEHDIPLTAHRVAADGDVKDATEAFAGAYGIGRDGAVIVRPDAVLAWRAGTAVSDPAGSVEQAMRRLLFRAATPAPTELEPA